MLTNFTDTTKNDESYLDMSSDKEFKINISSLHHKFILIPLIYLKSRRTFLSAAIAIT